MRSLLLLFFIVVIFGVLTAIPNGINNIAFGAVTGGSNFCSAFPTHPECTGWRIDPIHDNFWFCEYVDLPTLCNNPPDPQKKIIPRTDNYCCGVIGSHSLKYVSLDGANFTDVSKRESSLDTSKELVIWTDKDYYSFGDRVNVYGKFNFADSILKNNNQFVDISINDRKVILDLPVHPNGWFAGYFVLSNPYLYYTGTNLISVTYFHTPTLNEPDKFAQATYKIATGNITTKPFSIDVKSLSGKISYEIITESNEFVNLDLAITRLVTPNGLVLSLPSLSSVKDISDYLDDDVSLVPGKYEIIVTKGNHTTSQEFEYVK